MAAPKLIKPLDNQIINELAAFGPLNLREYFEVSPGSSAPVFTADIKSGQLPKGMICTPDGIMTGIPGKGTAGVYEIVLKAENEDGAATTEFTFTVKPAITNEATRSYDELKAQIWEAFNNKLPVPELQELYDLPLSLQDVLYLLERFAMIKIWDAFNLTPPGDLVPLHLEGASPHYNVYDRGSCLVASPKDLFSHERTLEDGLQTARALAREVYNRGWTIELVGYVKLTRAAWLEIQHLIDKYGKQLEVLNYSPSDRDVNLYTTQAIQREMNKTQ